MQIQTVGVLGCGLMGSGIAQVAAQAGYETVVRETEQKFIDKGFGGIQKSLGRFVEPGVRQTDGEGPYRRGGQCRHDGHGRRRVDSAGQERAERHVGHALACHGAAQQAVQGVDRIIVREP